MPKNPTQSNKPKTPKLRFPGFDGAWEEKKLGDLGDVIGGGTPETTKENYWNGQINWFTPTEIKEKYVYESSRKITKLGLEKSSAKMLPVGTLLFTSRATVGDVAITKKESTTNQGFQSLVVNEKNSNEFFYYWFIKNKKEFLKRANGSTFPEISSSEVKKIKSVFPQLPEQQKIASFLGGVDAWVENLREQKKSLESYKKSLMQKIFSGQIRFKDEKGNDFPEWEEKRLGEIFLGEKGTGLSKEKITEDGERECILYGELYTTYKEVIFNIKSKTNSKEGILSKIGDLLVPCSTTTVGIDLANVTALNKEGILLGGDITILRGKKEIDNIFYAYYLSNYKKNEIARYAQGVTIIHLYYNHFKNMMIDVPSLPEQQKIAEFLTSVDKSIESKQQQITKAEEWKKGLMQGLFV